MEAVFYISGAVAVIATALAVTRQNAVHALLYLIVSLLAVALVFFSLGAPFVAALEVIIYAGAIMVLFVFVIMMFNLGQRTEADPPSLTLKSWLGAILLVLVLSAELVFIFLAGAAGRTSTLEVTPKQVGMALLGPYVLGVEHHFHPALAGGDVQRRRPGLRDGRLALGAGRRPGDVHLHPGHGGGGGLGGPGARAPVLSALQDAGREQGRPVEGLRC
jgi:NADH-quinone oxidoreductase subunit J